MGRRNSTNSSEIGSVERQRKRVMNTRELPQDLTIEILLRLPIPSLMRFKGVCKLWYNLITSHDFVTMYRTSNIKVVSLFLDWYQSFEVANKTIKSTTVSFGISESSVKLTIPVSKGNINIVGCANGLVCLSHSNHQGDEKFIILNTKTKETRQIPIYKGRSSSGFCFDSTANNFKVACVTFHMVKGMNKAHLFTRTLRANSSWVEKEIGLPNLIFGKEKLEENMSSVTCIDTCLYWKIFDYSDSAARMQFRYSYILCFDMVSELFRRIEFPNFDSTPKYVALAPYKGYVALFSCYNPYFDVWVIDLDAGGGANKSMHKLRCTIDVPYAGFTYPLGFIIKDGTYWIATSCSGEIRYISEDGSTEKIFGRRGEGGLPKFFLYSESVVSVNSAKFADF